MKRHVALLLALLSSGCFPLMCGRTVPRGQFGLYQPPFLRAQLPDGDTLTVYRVKLWTFADNSPPSLQVEYEAPFPIADSAAVLRLNRRLWPAVVPYAETLGVSGVILTATNFRLQQRGRGATWQLRHYGAVVHRPHATRWMLGTDTIALSGTSTSDQVGIFLPDGERFEISSSNP
jgi:hypothetical protein